MSNILQIGYVAEGSTDNRFLSQIIQKTFEELSFECSGDIEVYPPVVLDKGLGNSFVDHITHLSIKYNYFHIICVHCDADDSNTANVLNYKINPAFSAVREITDEACKILVAVLPVYMIESWMLADVELLRAKMGTTLSAADLNLPRIGLVESVADPKDLIKKAVGIAQQGTSRRRRKLEISQLYSPVSQALSIQSLRQLPSFLDFESKARDALIRLGYL